MIVVMEIWHLKPGLEGRALEIMQEYDDMVEPPAHESSGWVAHGQFYQSAEDPRQAMMIYPWRSRALHDELVANEEPMLQEFYAKYCTQPREIRYFTELPVEHYD